MRIPEILIPGQLWRGVVLLALGHLISGTYVHAQCGNTSAGSNTVWGSCNSQTVKQGSMAIVDASQFAGANICAQIQAAFSQYVSRNNTYGIVVDARGINPTQACSGSNSNPWASWANTNPNLPSVVLLPSGTIQISSVWAMPQLARLVGEGPGVTILQAASGFTSPDMIDMGNSILCPAASSNTCPAVAIEHLRIDGNSGNNVSVNGIVNNNAQELSYVDDVLFSNISEKALWLNGQYAQNSGPYSNLTMSNVGTCVTVAHF